MDPSGVVSGFIYILIHDRRHGLLKIGRSVDVDDRLASINSATGVPGPFTVAHSRHCSDHAMAESLIHAELREFRYRKEFFEIPLRIAVRVVDSMVDQTEVEGLLLRTNPQAWAPIRDPISFGEQLRRARISKQLTQVELAELAGVGRRVVLEIENGKPTAQFGIVLRIAAVAGLVVAGQPLGNHQTRE